MGIEFRGGGEAAFNKMLSKMDDVAEKLYQKGKEVGGAPGVGIEDGGEDSRKRIRKSEQDLLSELEKMKKRAERALKDMPKALSNAMSGAFKDLKFSKIENAIREFTGPMKSIKSIGRELRDIGSDVDLSDWYEHVKEQSIGVAQVIDNISASIENQTVVLEQQTQAAENAAKAQEKLNKAIRNQPKTGGSKISADNSTAALMKGTNINRLLKQLNVSKEDAERVLSKFGEMAHMVSKLTQCDVIHGELDLDLDDEIQTAMKDITDMIMSVGSIKRERVEGLNEFYDYMRGKLIGYNDSDIAEFGDEWASVMKKFGAGKYKVLDKNARGVNDSWDEIVGMFRHLLENPDDATPQGQLKQVLGLLQKARDARKGPNNTYEKLPESMFDDIIVAITQDHAVIEKNATKIANEIMEAAARERELAAAANDTADAMDRQAKSAAKIDILKRNVDGALERLRGASDNKTALIDLTGVGSNKDLENEVRKMAEGVVGSDLKVDAVVVHEDIARISLYNEELGITASQMWKLTDATKDAKQAQLELISETQKHSPRAAQKYSDAQQKKIEQDNKWLIAQMSRLNTLERQYQHSDKKIDGTSIIGDIDGTSMAKEIDGTIDNLAAHIKQRISESVDGVLTEKTRNAILNDLRILDNEIKIAQYKEYAGTTMSPTEVGEARKQFEHMLDTIESKAKKSNVFDQVVESITTLRNRLTDSSLSDYVKDGTDVGKFVDSLRTVRAELSAAISSEGASKKEEQNLQNLLNLQERLYAARKKYAQYKLDGTEGTSAGIDAKRQADNLGQQVADAKKLVQEQENLNEAKRRQQELDENLNRFASEQSAQRKQAADNKAEENRLNAIREKYQHILDIINRINSLNSSILGLQKKNQSGAYTDSINSMQEEKLALMAGQDWNSINTFLDSLREQSALSEQEINKLSDAFRNLKATGADATNSVAQTFMKVAESAKNLSGNTFVDKNSGIYQQAVDAFNQYTSKVASIGGAQNASNWSAEEYAEVEALAKAYLELAGAFETTAEKQQAYFKGKQEYKSGDSISSIVPFDEQQNQLTEQEQAYQKLKASADEFAKSSGASGAIVTKFVQDANGISRLDFSVLEKGTMTMKQFSMEMGNLNQNKTFLTGLDMSSFTASIGAAKKQMESIIGFMQTLRGRGISLDVSSLSRLKEIQQELEKQLASGTAANEAYIASLMKESKVVISRETKRLNNMIQMEEAIANEQAIGFDKNIDPNGDIYKQLVGKAQELASTYNGVTLQTGRFDATTNTLNASLVHANGTVEQFKVSMYGLNGEVAAQQNGVGKLTTSWDRFKTSIGQAGKQLMTALVGYNVFFKAISEVRKGIGYVKEIDLALTELKKVTDETKKSYEQFLDTAADTAGKIGSTVSDFTEATANFARLNI